jgi:D-glycero-D-manno-heptose 1,7-bisphosphate phosphatase
MRKTFFFDRDGIVNTRIMGGYVRDKDDFEWMPDFFPFFRFVKEMGFLAVLVTNQQGIGKGLMTEQDLHDIHAMMQEQLRSKTGFAFDDIYFAGEIDMTPRKGCCGDITATSRRKPSPAMLLEAAEQWQIDLKNSWMIGDSISDTEAGRSAGVQTMLVGQFSAHDTDTADYLYPSLTAAFRALPTLIAVECEPDCLQQ